MILKQEERSEKNYLLTNSIGSFLLRISAMIMGFFTTWCLARLLGKEGYGDFTYIFSWLTLIGGLATIGLDVLLVRQIAQYQAKKLFAYNKGIIIFSLVLVIGLTTLLTFIGIQLTAVLYLQIALLTIPCVALLQLLQAIFRGQKHIIIGQVGELLVKPATFLLLLATAYWYTSMTLSLLQVIILNLVSYVLALVVSSILAWQKLTLPTIEPTYDFKNWMKGGLSFFVLSALGLLNVRTDVLMIGWLIGTEDLGVYNIALRLSDLPKLFLLVLNVALAPLITELYTKNDLQQLQQLLKQSIRWVLVLSLPLIIVLLIFGKLILSWWGDDFIIAYSCLVLLCIAQGVNIACGAVANVLNMIGYERFTFIGLSISMITNVLLNLFLIPSYGIEGAAIATMISIAVWNGILVIGLYRKTGLNSTVF